MAEVAVFPYRPGNDNLVLVNKEDFEACTQKHVITTINNGPAILYLPKNGDYYYCSGVRKHCEAGQKLHITVVQGKGSSGDPFPFKVTPSAPPPTFSE